MENPYRYRIPAYRILRLTYPGLGHAEPGTVSGEVPKEHFEGFTSLYYQSEPLEIPTDSQVLQLYWYSGALASDKSGNLYFSNTNYNVVWKLDPAGKRTVFAGKAKKANPTDNDFEAASPADGGEAARQPIPNPSVLYMDEEGTLFIGQGAHIVQQNKAASVFAVRGGRVSRVFGGGSLFKKDESVSKVSDLLVPAPITTITKDDRGRLLVGASNRYLFRATEPGMPKSAGLITGALSKSSSVADGQTTRLDLSAGSPQLGFVTAVMIDRQDRIVYADDQLRRIIRIEKGSNGEQVFRVLAGGGLTIGGFQPLSPKTACLGSITTLREAADGTLFFLETRACQNELDYNATGYRVGRISADGKELSYPIGASGMGRYRVNNGVIENQRDVAIPPRDYAKVEGANSNELYFYFPQGLALASDGSIFVADSHAGLVFRFTPVAGAKHYKTSVVLGDGARHKFQCSATGTCGFRTPVDGARAKGASLDFPAGLGFAKDGSLLVSTYSYSAAGLFKVDRAGHVRRVAGGGKLETGPLPQPGTDVGLHLASLTQVRPGLWLGHDGSNLVQRIEEGPGGDFLVSSFFNRAEVSPGCGATTIEGTASEAAFNGALRASLSSVCVNHIVTVAGKDTCDKPGGYRRAIIATQSDFTIGNSTLVDAQAACQ